MINEPSERSIRPCNDCCHLRRQAGEAASREAASIHSLKAQTGDARALPSGQGVSLMQVLKMVLFESDRALQDNTEGFIKQI